MIFCPVQSPCRITQHFSGNRQIYKRFGLIGHNGIDFTGESKGKKVWVYSPFDGLVVKTGTDSGYGKYVRIYTPADASGKRRDVVLGHLSSITVKQGQWIPMGDQVGIMGSTGFSTGVHLHLGLRYMDDSLNILDFDNGYMGYVNFEEYLRFWVDKSAYPNIVEYPNG